MEPFLIELVAKGEMPFSQHKIISGINDSIEDREIMIDLKRIEEKDRLDLIEFMAKQNNKNII